MESPRSGKLLRKLEYKWKDSFQKHFYQGLPCIENTYTKCGGYKGDQEAFEEIRDNSK